MDPLAPILLGAFFLIGVAVARPIALVAILAFPAYWVAEGAWGSDESMGLMALLMVFALFPLTLGIVVGRVIRD